MATVTVRQPANAAPPVLRRDDTSVTYRASQIPDGTAFDAAYDYACDKLGAERLEVSRMRASSAHGPVGGIVVMRKGLYDPNRNAL